MNASVLHRLEAEFSQAALDFKENIDRINARKNCETENLSVFRARISELETRETLLEKEIQNLEYQVADHSNVCEQYEKRMKLLQTENLKLRQKVAQSDTFEFDQQKYKRALLYIDQLQSKLSSN